MNNRLAIFIFITILGIIGISYLSSGKQLFNFSPNTDSKKPFKIVDSALAAKFDYLSKNGNSACSVSFKDSIPKMSDGARLTGSCCSPMSPHRYSEQIEALKKYKDIPEIPSDPYDIPASLAKKMLAYYDVELGREEQNHYDYAMQNSHEKGPCCCRCWRWFVYGGLGKYLIKNYNFTGSQLAELWNFSDGCGGDEEHIH